MSPFGERSPSRTLKLLGLFGVAAGLAVPSAAASVDQQLASALVVPHRDVPTDWNATIEPNPCKLIRYPATVQITAHAATRWGSITHGLWSAAAVAPSAVEARGEFAYVVASLPGCMTRSLRRAPRGYTSQVTTVPISYRNDRADELRAWKVTGTVRTPKNRISSHTALEVVAVRVGHAVAWYELGTGNEKIAQTILRRALSRALSASH